MVDFTAKEAAAQIVSLINSRPATPWPREIEAIIARVAPAATALPASVHAGAVAQFVPVDPELVRLISEWRRQRDIVDRTVFETDDGIERSLEEWKPIENIIGDANGAASDLAQQIWQRAKAETWSGGPVNPLTLAVLAEIAFHHENGATNALEGDGDGCADEKAFSELMVAALAFARSVGVGSDLLPMEGRFLPPALLKGGRAHE